MSPAAAAPFTDLSQLPLVLLLPDVARLFRRSRGTVYRDLQNGTFRPAPSYRHPYRWLKPVIVQHFERQAAALHVTPPPVRAPRRRRRPR
jgi:hypothetical protein